MLYGFYIDSDTFVQFFQINQIDGHFFKLKHDMSVVNLDFVIPRHRRRDIVLALSVWPALSCLEPYLGSALADFIETWYEYIYA